MPDGSSEAYVRMYMQSSDPHSYAVSDNNSKAIVPIIAVIIQYIHIPRYYGNRRLRNLISAKSPELLS